MMKLGTDYEFIASLPPSEHPWKIHAFDRCIVLVNPEHPARVVKPDGTINILKGSNHAGKVIEIQSPCIQKSYVAICTSKLIQNLGGKS